MGESYRMNLSNAWQANEEKNEANSQRDCFLPSLHKGVFVHQSGYDTLETNELKHKEAKKQQAIFNRLVRMYLKDNWHIFLTQSLYILQYKYIT